MIPTRTSQLRVLKVQIVVAVAINLLVAWAAGSWLGWWAAPFMASFGATFTWQQVQQLRAERARIAAVSQQHIAEMEADLGQHD